MCCSYYNHPPKFFPCFDFGAFLPSIGAYLLLLSSIRVVIKTYIFMLFLWYNDPDSISFKHKLTSDLTCSIVGLASKNYTILEGRSTIPLEIAQFFLAGQPWAWKLRNSGWQPSLDDKNCAKYPLSS